MLTQEHENRDPFHTTSIHQQCVRTYIVSQSLIFKEVRIRLFSEPRCKAAVCPPRTRSSTNYIMVVMLYGDKVIDVQGGTGRFNTQLCGELVLSLIMEER